MKNLKKLITLLLLSITSLTIVSCGVIETTEKNYVADEEYESMKIFKEYAKNDGGTDAPTIANYKAIGIDRVADKDTLKKANELIAEVEEEAVGKPTDIQDLLYDSGIIVPKTTGTPTPVPVTTTPPPVTTTPSPVTTTPPPVTTTPPPVTTTPPPVTTTPPPVTTTPPPVTTTPPPVTTTPAPVTITPEPSDVGMLPDTDTTTSTDDTVDTEPPVITLLGSLTLTLEVGTISKDPGVTVSDNKDHDLITVIKVQGGNGETIKPVSAGEYDITYNVTDRAGNKAVEQRRHIIAIDNLTPPIFVGYKENTVTEGAIDAITVTARDTNGIKKYYIKGTDADKFNIDANTGKVTFKTPAVYSPTKAKYYFDAVASDGEFETIQPIIITVTQKLKALNKSFTILRTFSTGQEVNPNSDDSTAHKLFENGVPTSIVVETHAGKFQIDRDGKITLKVDANILIEDSYLVKFHGLDSNNVASNSAAITITVKQ